MPLRHYIKVILLLLLLICSAVVTVLLFEYERSFFAIFSIMVGCLSLFLIIRSLTFAANKVAFMFNAIENDDFTFRFTGSQHSHRKLSSDAYLNEALNRIKGLVLEARVEARERERYFEIILEQVSTGIVVINDTGIVFRNNNEALKLLQVAQLSHIGQLSVISPTIPNQFLEIRDGESRMIRFYDDASEVTLSIAATDVELQGKSLKIVTITDIAEDIDSAELDSWSRMSRVLTHEIMNSLAPITSLSETLLSTDDAVTTRRGLEIINSTSQNLKGFVENYRSLTRIPAPKFEDIDLIELTRHEIELFGSDIEIKSTLSSAVVSADKGLVAQAIVNLLKNGVEVVSQSEGETAIVWVEIGINLKGRVYIDVCNNGTQISEDIRENLFVPFFTTKEGGSGIGLSLSRQIMRLHQGALTLSTKPVTRFRMQF